MVLDITVFRTNPAAVKESQKRRFKPEEEVDAIIDLDNKLKKEKHERDQIKAQVNKLNAEIGQKFKAKEDASELVTKRDQMNKDIENFEKNIKDFELELKRALTKIGNLVHDSVPVSKDEANNDIIKKWGELRSGAELKHHHELLYMVDGFDLPRGTNVAGHRGYFLKGVGVMLNFALIQYGLDFLRKRGYTPLQTPFFMNKEVMASTAQLEQFDEELYKVIGGSKDDPEEKYLIATSEQPISAYHQNEWIEPKSLPLKYVGISTCFRKEAGAHGKDTWGIFRVHQFEKIEQFCITSPDKSWEMQEDMLKASEEFYQSLGIPYRVVTIVSGELNNAAAKKYDLEGWFPGFQEYRELVSCSNCTDYQSRSLEIRYGAKSKDDKEKKYVHMLNSTLCATTRTICAIMENYQRENGVEVPEVLQSYLGGTKLFEYVHKDFPTPKNTKAAAPAPKKDANKN